ncbi:MAG: DsrE family protein [Sedimenticolaceae bacterium]
MQTIKALAIGVIATVMLLAAPAQAKEDKSMGLFINLTMLATVPAGHALHMAEKQMERGHPVTFFLNNQAVLFASKRTPLGKFHMAGKTVREMLTNAMAKGATVIVCQMCAKMNGLDPSDFIEGAMLGNPELVAEYLFDPSYQVLSW